MSKMWRSFVTASDDSSGDSNNNSNNNNDLILHAQVCDTCRTERLLPRPLRRRANWNCDMGGFICYDESATTPTTAFAKRGHSSSPSGGQKGVPNMLEAETDLPAVTPERISSPRTRRRQIEEKQNKYFADNVKDIRRRRSSPRNRSCGGHSSSPPSGGQKGVPNMLEGEIDLPAVTPERISSPRTRRQIEEKQNKILAGNVKDIRRRRSIPRNRSCDGSLIKLLSSTFQVDYGYGNGGTSFRPAEKVDKNATHKEESKQGQSESKGRDTRESVGDGDETDLCALCMVGGDHLLECFAERATKQIGCGKAVHIYCVGREDFPHGDWICTGCAAKEGLGVHSGFWGVHSGFSNYGHEFPPTDAKKQPMTKIDFAEKVEAHEALCGVCNVGGDLITCFSPTTRGRGCGKTFHMFCLRREDRHTGDWMCSCCSKKHGFPLDEQFPSIGYDVSPSSGQKNNDQIDDMSESYDSAGDDQESQAWTQVRVGSRIDIYWEEDDTYYSATVEKTGPAGHCHLRYDGDGEREVLDLSKEKIRLLSDSFQRDEYTPASSDIDPSQQNYIVCGRGVTKAHLQKHGYLTFRHYIDTMFGEYDNAESGRKNRVCTNILSLLNDEYIQFIQWDPKIDGFAQVRDEECITKIKHAFRNKRAVKATEADIGPPSVDLDAPIRHVLLVNGGKSFTSNSLPQKRSAIDPFDVADQSQKAKKHALIHHGSTHGQDEKCALWQGNAKKTRISSSMEHGESQQEDHSYLPESRKPKQARTSIQQQLIDEMLELPIRGSRCCNAFGRKAQPPSGERGITRNQPSSLEYERLEDPMDYLPKKPPAKNKAPSASRKPSPANPTFTHALAKEKEKATPVVNLKAPIYNVHQVKHWKQSILSLKAFREEHGHCAVPSAYPPDPHLASWAKRQRHQYNLFVRGSNLTGMSMERIEALNSIGFCWNIWDTKWYQRYEQLVQFQKRFGHTRMTTKITKDCKDPGLMAWVKHQRRQKQFFDEGKGNELTEERAKLLNDIGFT